MSDLFDYGYALLIGIGTHKKDSGIPDLPTTINDVSKLSELLSDQEKCGYLPNNVQCLKNDKATKQGILDGLDNLIDATKRDTNATVFFYFSGHGVELLNSQKSRYYLIPHDCDKDNIEASGIDDQTLSNKLSKLEAMRIVVIIDSCHSGGLIKEHNFFPSRYNPSPVLEPVVDSLKEGSGRVVIASSMENQRSFLLEPDFEHSIFTYHLLEALSGEAYVAKPPRIGIFEVYIYLDTKVPETAKKQIDAKNRFSAQQSPVFACSPGVVNFPIALLPRKAEALYSEHSIDEPLFYLKQQILQMQSFNEQAERLYEDFSSEESNTHHLLLSIMEFSELLKSQFDPLMELPDKIPLESDTLFFWGQIEQLKNALHNIKMISIQVVDRSHLRGELRDQLYTLMMIIRQIKTIFTNLLQNYSG